MAGRRQERIPPSSALSSGAATLVVRDADFSVIFAPSPSATHGPELAGSLLGKTLFSR